MGRYIVGGAYNTGGTSPKSLDQMTEETTAKIKEREDEVRKILDQVIGMYQPGGTYGQGTEAMLERTKEKDMASAASSLVSSGLFGSTLTAGLGKKWEEEVGTPSRLKLEDTRYGMLTSALTKKADFVTDIQNQYPDYGMIAQLIAKQSSVPSMPTTPGFGKGVGPDAAGIPTYRQSTERQPTGYYGGKPVYN